MKKIKLSIFALLTGLALAGIYSCKGVEEEPVADPTKIVVGTVPTITPTAPAAVTVKEGDVVESASTTAFVAAVSSSSSATVVTNAVAAAQKVVADPAALAAAVTAAGTEGTVSTTVQATLTKLAADPTIAALLTTLTLPSVDGTAVSGRIGEVEAISATGDQCKADYLTAYTAGQAALLAQKTAAESPITAAYTAAAAKATADATSCKTSATASITTKLAKAKTDYTTLVASINGSSFSALIKNLLTAIVFVMYQDKVSDLTKLQTSGTAACDKASTKALANAVAARDKDLLTIKNNYTTELNKLTATYNLAVAGCHNQGSGN